MLSWLGRTVFLTFTCGESDTMEQALRDLIELSTAIGADPALVQGGGGNTSTKDDNRRMYVKASGVALKDMNAEEGYRIVDLDRCCEILSDDSLGELPPVEREQEIAVRLGAACIDGEGESRGRPSVETNLHALLGRCVAHTHPAAVNAILCSEGTETILSDLYGDMDPPYLFVEYVDFGYPLARRMERAISSYRESHGAMPAVIFLENHGLFASAGSVEDVLSITGEVVGRAERHLRDAARSVRERELPVMESSQRDELILCVAAELRGVYAGLMDAPVLVAHDLGEEVRAFLHSPRPQRLAETPSLVPEQQVYCNGAPLWVDFSADHVALRREVRETVEAAAEGPGTPVCVLVDGIGMFTAGAGVKLLDTAMANMRAALKILVGADLCGTPRSLPQEAIAHIRESEWEKYRHAMYETGGEASGLSGKVAVVSGAGSGLGRGISIGLAREGMHVVAADIDGEGARETVRRIGEAGGDALALQVDVTDEDGVSGLYVEVVKRRGGVDLLVNCASVAPPLPLLEFPADAFRRALEINLTGYMLMAREAARVMQRQGAGGSIINLSSKSALEPSKNNSAYNATKAGEVHMARGWALELAQHGIRVNSVCPGNVFQESKIWSEEYIAAVAEKRGISPEEVIPHYIGMTALQQEITWDDVAGAVLFLAGDGAAKITGQTLVVDAGQVFVR